MPQDEAGAGDGELAAREASEQTQQAGERNAMELAGMDTLRGLAVGGSLKLFLFVQGVWTRTQGGRLGRGCYWAHGPPCGTRCLQQPRSIPSNKSAALLAQPLHKVVQQQRPLRGREGGQQTRWRRGQSMSLLQPGTAN